MPKQLQPKPIALEYYKAIRRYLDAARALVEREVFPLIPSTLAEGGTFDAARMDAGKKINAAVDRVSKQFFDGLRPEDIERIARKFADRTSDFQRGQLAKQARSALGVDVFIPEPGLAARAAAFTSENVALIKSVPNKYLDDVEKTILRAVRQGTRAETLAKTLQRKFKLAENQAKLIARDQVGKYYAELNRARQQALGVDRYVWRTAGDDRVRDEHAALNGKTFAWSRPPSEGHPGEAINCRCQAEPDFSGVLGRL